MTPPIFDKQILRIPSPDSLKGYRASSRNIEGNDEDFRSEGPQKSMMLDLFGRSNQIKLIGPIGPCPSIPDKLVSYGEPNINHMRYLMPLKKPGATVARFHS